jgi:hypothetical protein
MEGFNFTRAVTGAATGEETVRVDTEPKLLVVDEQGHLPIDFILRSGLLTGSDVVVNRQVGDGGTVFLKRFTVSRGHFQCGSTSVHFPKASQGLPRLGRKARRSRGGYFRQPNPQTVHPLHWQAPFRAQ